MATNTYKPSYLQSLLIYPSFIYPLLTLVWCMFFSYRSKSLDQNWLCYLIC